MTQSNSLRLALATGMIGGMALLAGCSSPPPPQTTSTSTETTSSQTVAPNPPPTMAPAPMMQPGAPGTITTKTTHSEVSD